MPGYRTAVRVPAVRAARALRYRSTVRMPGYRSTVRVPGYRAAVRVPVVQVVPPWVPGARFEQAGAAVPRVAVGILWQVTPGGMQTRQEGYAGR